MKSKGNTRGMKFPEGLKSFRYVRAARRKSSIVPHRPMFLINTTFILPPGYFQTITDISQYSNYPLFTLSSYNVDVKQLAPINDELLEKETLQFSLSQHPCTQKKTGKKKSWQRFCSSLFSHKRNSEVNYQNLFLSNLDTSKQFRMQISCNDSRWIVNHSIGNADDLNFEVHFASPDILDQPWDACMFITDIPNHERPWDSYVTVFLNTTFVNRSRMSDKSSMPVNSYRK